MQPLRRVDEDVAVRTAGRIWWRWEPADRIKWIKAEQAREAAYGRASKDMEKLLKWTNECATQHEAQVLATLPEPAMERASPVATSPAGVLRNVASVDGSPSRDGPAAEGDRRGLGTAAEGVESRTAPGWKLAPPEKWAVLADWARHVLQARLCRGVAARPFGQGG